MDFDETFAPTCHMTIVRSIGAITAHRGRNVHQLDIKTAFLNGDLHYLGIQFMQVDGGIALCQSKYIDTLCNILAFKTINLLPLPWRQVYI